MIEHILQRQAQQFPSLRRIVVAGHSAGGQYTQRWALLTNSRVFDDGADHASSKTHHLHGLPNLQAQRTSQLRHLQRPRTDMPTIRVVVANPRSLCFLDARRILPDGSFGIPANATDCPWYNQWEWGLGSGDALVTPYKDRSIQQAGGVDAIVRRYPNRDIVYLAGEFDVVPSSGDKCQTLDEGPNRRSRSLHFFESLKELYGGQVHHRLVVKGVPHDHTLMFQSSEGQQALFGTFVIDDPPSASKQGTHVDPM